MGKDREGNLNPLTTCKTQRSLANIFQVSMNTPNLRATKGDVISGGEIRIVCAFNSIGLFVFVKSDGLQYNNNFS